MSAAVYTTPVNATPADVAPNAPAAGGHLTRVQEIAARVAKEDDAAPVAEAKDAAAPAEEPKADGDAEPKPEDAKADEAEKTEDEPKAPKVSDDPKLAAKFSALAKQAKAVREGREEVEAGRRVLAERAQQLTHEYQTRVAAVEKREAEINARHTQLVDKFAEVEKALDDPDRIFQLLQERHGLQTMEDLARYAKKNWNGQRKPLIAPVETPKPKEPENPDDKPLTLKQWRELQAQESQRTQQSAAEQSAQADFHKELESADDKGAEKYEAAVLVYSKAERLQKALEVANGLRANGKGWTSQQLAAAVDALARQEERWQRFEKKRAPQQSSRTENDAGTKPAIKTAASPPAKPQGPRTLTNDSATEVASPPKTDTETTPIDRRARRKAHLAKIAAS